MRASALLPLLGLAACSVLSAEAPSAVGPTWKLDSYVAPGGVPETFDAGTPDSFTLRLRHDGDLFGKAACNGFGGKYRLTGRAFRPYQIISTLVGCDGEAGRQEDAYYDALVAATRLDASPTRLVVRFGEGGTMTFLPAPR